MSLLLTRPRPSFASAFSETVRDDVVHWISKAEARIGPEAYKTFIGALPSEDAHFRKLLETAMLGGAGDTDAYRIASDLHTILDWPVDQSLVILLATAIERTRLVTLRQATIAWVMETGTRFDSKAGENVSYRGDSFVGQRTGKVSSIDRPIAAAAVVDPYGTTITVYAENLVKP